MEIHERYFTSKEADLKFQEFMLILEREYGLTYGELFQILSSYISNLSKYLIREERHPEDVTKKGDEK